MKAKGETVQIMGKKLLKCHQEACKWNLGWLGGHSWIEEPGKGTRICNLGARAIFETKAAPPDDCSQSSAVLELAFTELEF